MTKLPPLPLTDGALIISSGFLEAIGTCPRLAEYQRLWRRIPADTSPGMTFGGILHKVFEMHFRQKEFGTPQARLDEKVLSLLVQSFADAPHMEGDWRTANWAMEIYNRFAARYEHEQFKPLAWDKPQKCTHCNEENVKECDWCNGTGLSQIMCEVPFIHHLYDARVDFLGCLGTGKSYEKTVPVYVQGYVDLPVVIDDKLFILDYKTTSRLGSQFWDEKALSAQQRGYCYAWNELTKTQPAGYIVRAIRTKEPPQYVMKGGDSKKINDWWYESFHEERKYVEKSTLENWKRNAIAKVEEFLYFYQKGFFPEHDVSCVSKYGRCAYFEVCNYDPADGRHSLLESGLYKDKEIKQPTQ